MKVVAVIKQVVDAVLSCGWVGKARWLCLWEAFYTQASSAACFEIRGSALMILNP